MQLVLTCIGQLINHVIHAAKYNETFLEVKCVSVKSRWLSVSST